MLLGLKRLWVRARKHLPFRRDRPNLPLNEMITTGGHKLNMRVTRRLQHGPRIALQMRLQG